MIHNIRRNAKYPKRNVEVAIPDSESPIDSLIPAVIPRAIDVIRNSCGPLDPLGLNGMENPRHKSGFTFLRA